jgi:four helix bundle protein
MAKGPIYQKSFAFAIRVIKLARFLQTEKREYVISKQVVRSGTAIGAMVREGEFAESKCDFVHKMHVALKEANETLYWLELLHASELIDHPSFESISSDNDELIRLLVAIVKTSKESLNTN